MIEDRSPINRTFWAKRASRMCAFQTLRSRRPVGHGPYVRFGPKADIRNSIQRASAGGYCAWLGGLRKARGLTALARASRLSIVFQLICKLKPLGVLV